VLAFRREQGRATQVPFWQRYYLDLALVGLCVVGYLEFGQFGGLNLRAQLGQSAGQGPDPLLLATPRLLLLGGALLALRLFPLATAVGVRLAARGRGTVGLLALAQVGRAAGQFALLTLLLTLSVGLGLFALTYQISLSQSATDRAAYMTGGDERVVIRGEEYGTQLTAPFQARFARMPGVEGVTPLYRSRAATNEATPTDIGLLGIDPTTFGQVAHWRTDYADHPLAALPGGMRQHTQGAHAGDQGHPIWALLDPTCAATLHAQPGDRFSLQPTESVGNEIFFVVGAVVHNTPTMYDSYPGGYLVVNISDYLAALANPSVGDNPVNGPTEFWLRTACNPSATQQRAHVLAYPDFFVASTTDRRALAARFQADPLTAGIAGLLLAGAGIAALLALLGTIAQAAVAARHRATQFAILRTLGMGGAN
jgi:putative ABC transport system permease protein